MTRRLLVSCALAAACSDGGGSPDGGGDDWSPEIAVDYNRDIDILFVVDNSGSMRQEQASLGYNFPRFIDTLQSIEGGLPNIHLGVVSSNVGTGPVGGGGDSCAGNGDNGQLQVPEGCPALAENALFIRDVAVDEDQGIRDFNYTGDLASQFACMAQLGTTGCGFEQHLESMRRALEPGNPTNQGFVRDEAYLAVIFLQDEDDCSTTTEGREMFDASQDDREAPLGEMTSFRCFEFGTTCEPADERTFGPRDNCVPGDDDTDYMASIESYVDFLKGLKVDPSMVFVAGITGDRENADGVVVVGEHPFIQPPVLWVEPTCVVCPDGSPTGCSLNPSDPDSALVDAAPAIRMRGFLDAFPERSSWQNICSYDPEIADVDLSGALTQIAELLAKSFDLICPEGPLATPLDCSVTDVRNSGQPEQEEFPIPSCEVSNPPCWSGREDRVQCPATESGVIIDVERGGTPPPAGTVVVVSCRLD